MQRGLAGDLGGTGVVPFDLFLDLLGLAGELGFEQVESAVLNVARYDVFKLSEAMLSGDPARLVRVRTVADRSGRTKIGSVLGRVAASVG